MSIQYEGARQESRIKFLSNNLKAQDHSEELGVDDRITLHWILEQQRGRLRNGL